MRIELSKYANTCSRENRIPLLATIKAVFKSCILIFCIPTEFAEGVPERRGTQATCGVPTRDVAFNMGVVRGRSSDWDVYNRRRSRRSRDAAVDGIVRVMIVNGRGAAPENWPWQAHLYLEGSTRGLCGGSLVDTGGPPYKWVLTAAHCIYSCNVSDWVVYLGKRYTYDTNDAQRHTVTRIISNPTFAGSEGGDGDVALMELTEPAIITARVMPVCLPPSNFTLPDQYRTFVTGFGDTQGTSSPDLLKQAEVPIVSKRECRNLYEGPAIYNPIHITENMICAGGEGKDSCMGDSGGPLVYRNPNGTYMQVGVTTFGISSIRTGECDVNHPSVYASVSSYRNWIMKQTSGEGQDSCDAFHVTRTKAKDAKSFKGLISKFNLGKDDPANQQSRPSSH